MALIYKKNLGLLVSLKSKIQSARYHGGPEQLDKHLGVGGRHQEDQQQAEKLYEMIHPSGKFLSYLYFFGLCWL